MLAAAGCVCAKEQNLLFFYLTPEGFNLSCNSCVMMSVMTLEDFKILYLVLFKSFWLIKKKRKKEIETINLAICLSGEGSAHKLRGRIGPLLQSVFNTGVPSSFGEKPSRLLDTGTPLSWCQFTEKTNKWVMDVIQTIEESSPWQVVGRRTASDWMLLALLWMWN